jgi:hypothetical protein
MLAKLCAYVLHYEINCHIQGKWVVIAAGGWGVTEYPTLPNIKA